MITRTITEEFDENGNLVRRITVERADDTPVQPFPYVIPVNPITPFDPWRIDKDEPPYTIRWTTDRTTAGM